MSSLDIKALSFVIQQQLQCLLLLLLIFSVGGAARLGRVGLFRGFLNIKINISSY